MTPVFSCHFTFLLVATSLKKVDGMMMDGFGMDGFSFGGGLTCP